MACALCVPAAALPSDNPRPYGAAERYSAAAAAAAARGVASTSCAKRCRPTAVLPGPRGAHEAAALATTGVNTVVTRDLY